MPPFSSTAAEGVRRRDEGELSTNEKHTRKPELRSLYAARHPIGTATTRHRRIKVPSSANVPCAWLELRDAGRLRSGTQLQAAKCGIADRLEGRRLRHERG